MTQTRPDRQAQWNARAVYLIDPNTGLAMANDGSFKVVPREVIPVTLTGAAAAAVTANVPAPGATLYNYLAYYSVVMYAATAQTGAATPIVVPINGLPGTPTLTFPTALPIGQEVELKYEGAYPIKGSALNGALSIACPATAGVIWRVNLCYFAA